MSAIGVRRTLATFGAAVIVAAAGCERVAASRAPDVPFEPTPYPVVAQMLALAQVSANDVVYDLGCGDGRIVIAAARLGARGVCVDIDPQRIRESRANAEREGVAGRIEFRNEDLFETDIRDATVVTLFLWPKVNLKLRPKLWRDLKTGTRVVSYIHTMGDWAPQDIREVEGARGPRKLYLWRVTDNDRRTVAGVASTSGCIGGPRAVSAGDFLSRRRAEAGSRSA